MWDEIFIITYVNYVIGLNGWPHISHVPSTICRLLTAYYTMQHFLGHSKCLLEKNSMGSALVTIPYHQCLYIFIARVCYSYK